MFNKLNIFFNCIKLGIVFILASAPSLGHGAIALTSSHSIQVSLETNGSSPVSVDFIEHGAETNSDRQISNPLSTSMSIAGKQLTCVAYGGCSYVDGDYEFSLTQNGDDLEINFGVGPYLPHLNYADGASELLILKHSSTIVISAPGASFSIYNSIDPSEVIPLEQDFTANGAISVSFISENGGGSGTGSEGPPDFGDGFPNDDPDFDDDDPIDFGESGSGCQLNRSQKVNNPLMNILFLVGFMYFGFFLKRYQPKENHS